MDYLDLTFENAEYNLACDEALLDCCEDGSADEILRFWEPKDPFVVLGYSNKIQVEVAINSCKALGVPILRRASGGGAVVQGPGCLNYSLVLKMDGRPQLKSLTETNRFILQKHYDALTTLLCHPEVRQDRRISKSEILRYAQNDKQEAGLAIQGLSDLTLHGLKFSGNAQRRKKNALLYHGTFLLDFELEKIGRCLRMPSRQPDYRKNRPHSEFVTNLNLPANDVKSALKKIWGSNKKLSAVPGEKIDQLVQEKYSQADWNEKF